MWQSVTETRDSTTCSASRHIQWVSSAQCIVKYVAKYSALVSSGLCSVWLCESMTAWKYDSVTVWQCDTHTRHSSHILTSGGPSRKDDSDDACGMDEKVQLTFKLVKDNLDSLVPAVDSWVRVANGNCLSLLWGIFRKSQLFNSFAPSRLKIELKSSYSVVLGALQWNYFKTNHSAIYIYLQRCNALCQNMQYFAARLLSQLLGWWLMFTICAHCEGVEPIWGVNILLGNYMYVWTCY